MKANIIIMAVLGALALTATSAKATVLDFDNVTGTYISFSGSSTFNFTSDLNGNQFQITSTGPSEGLDGFLTQTDLFTIGTVSGSGMVETASVAGTATLVIADGHGFNLTGSLQWGNIATFDDAGVVDYTGSVDIENIKYGGTDSDLLALSAAGAASDVVSFQFTSAMTLSQLAASGGETSYSGSISPVPEPSSALMLLVGSACFYAILRWRRAMDI